MNQTMRVWLLAVAVIIGSGAMAAAVGVKVDVHADQVHAQALRTQLGKFSEAAHSPRGVQSAPVRLAGEGED